MYKADLLKYGWSKDRECHCSGTLEEIYKNPQAPRHTVNIFPDKGKFEIWYETKRIQSQSLTELSNYLELTFKNIAL
jgi:hypothetical protein